MGKISSFGKFIIEKSSDEEDIQYEEVCSIFDEFFSDESDSGVEKNDKQIFVTIYCGDTIQEYANELSEFDEITKGHQVKIQFLKRIRIGLDRLTHLKYEWNVNIDEEQISITITRNDKEVTLYDAFGGQDKMRYVNQAIMSKILKEKYNLTFSFHQYNPSTSGYYGNRATIKIWIKEVIPENSTIVKDLQDLRKVTTYQHQDNRDVQAFYKVEIFRWETSSMITLELNS